MGRSMAPPVPAESPTEESAVPLKKARREKGSTATARQAPKEGRKRPNSLGRIELQENESPHGSQPPATGGFTPASQNNQQSSTPLPPGKMLLPRLHQHKNTTPDSKPSAKERTSHACEKCRKAKAKCSGGQPCEKCKQEARECIYGDGKRDKVRKELERLAKQNRELKKQSLGMVDFLHSLYDGDVLPQQAKDEIDDYLSNLKSVQPDKDDHDQRRGSGDTGEDDADAEEVASMGSLDAINEDTNENEETRAAGYLGKSSAVRWVQRTKDYLEQDDDTKGSQKDDAKQPHNAFTAASTHADDRDYHFLDPAAFDPYEMPQLEQARTLIDAYFTHVHPSLPILGERDFRNAFDKYVVNEPSHNHQIQVPEKQRNFICSLNMVFAIAARHAHVTNAYYQGERNDFLIYFARAQAMGLDERALHKDAELENTTSLGLVSLFFLTLELINRAWTWSGVALRSCLTLGLHLRSQTKSLSDVDKEYRVRIFWSLYCLERLLNQLTGRPSCISPRDICANLPLNRDESTFDRDISMYDVDRTKKSEFYGASAEAAARAVPRSLPQDSSRSEEDGSPMDTSPVSKFSSMTSTDSSSQSQGRASSEAIASQELTSTTYFIHRIRLSIITHEIFNDLYSPTMVNSKWGDVQDVIRRIDKTLRQWRDSMPWQLHFDPENPRCSEPPEWRVGESPRGMVERKKQWADCARERIGLSMFWNSSRMILYRPTLCRISPGIQHESERSKAFNSAAASTCIQSARNMIACLPPFSSDQRNKQNLSYDHKDYVGKLSAEIVGIHDFVPWWNTSYYIIEAASVLMMEMAYRADHVPAQAEGLFLDAKTAVGWMRELAHSSIVAKKGRVIYETLLRRVAPRVGRNAGELTRDGSLPRGWEDSKPVKRDGDDHDTSSDTIRWSGHNESAARFEPRRGQQSPQQTFGMQQQQQQPSTYGGQLTHQQHNQPQQFQQTTAPSPNSMYQPLTTMGGGAQRDDYLHVGGVGTLGLDALEGFHFAGDVYGRYDQFGPWLNGFDNFGIFDPVMDARLGMGASENFGGLTQHSSPFDNSHLTGLGNNQMGAAGGNMAQHALSTPNMGSQQHMGQSNPSPLGGSHMLNGHMGGGGQMGNQHIGNGGSQMANQQLGGGPGQIGSHHMGGGAGQIGGHMNQSPHSQMSQHHIPAMQLGPNGGMSTGAPMPAVTALEMGRSFAYDASQQNHQQLPPMQQLGVGGAQQGGGYTPFVWEGGSLPPPTQQQAQHHLPPAHGMQMKPSGLNNNPHGHG